jgi:hypothetical protein
MSPTAVKVATAAGAGSLEAETSGAVEISWAARGAPPQSQAAAKR